MKASIDRSGCIGCGVCASVCPQIFRMADDGLAETIFEDVPFDVEGSAQEAAQSCPVSVITVE